MKLALLGAKVRAMPRYGWFGGGLLLLGQLLTLLHLQPICEYWYGIIWLGFIFFADAVVYLCGRRSLIMNRQRDLALMFGVSALLWWGFEVANLSHLNNWTYTVSPTVPLWLQRIRSTLFFSTLIPATWESMLLALSLPWAQRKAGYRAWIIPRWALALLAIFGVAAGGLGFLWPTLSLPLYLTALVVLLDLVNYLCGSPSLLGRAEKGDARLAMGLCGGALAAGVLGEFWNYWAVPKWTYRVDYIQFAHLFEMPLLGYCGYPLLALALFVTYHFVRRLVPGMPVPSSADLDADDPLALSGL